MKRWRLSWLWLYRKTGIQPTPVIYFAQCNYPFLILFATHLGVFNRFAILQTFFFKPSVRKFFFPICQKLRAYGQLSLVTTTVEYFVKAY